MMTDADNTLALHFAATRRLDGSGDWADVRRRVRRDSRSRSRTVAVAAVLFAAILASTATLAVGGTLHDLFFGKPAPPLIKKEFVQQNKMTREMRKWQRIHGEKPASVPPQIDAAKAHGVLAVKTPDGLLRLWAAPAIGSARECWFVDFAVDQHRNRRSAVGSGSCAETPAPPSKIQWGYGWTITHRTLKELTGRLYVDASTVVVYSPGSRPRRVPVVDGFFLAAFPRATKTPHRLVALDSHGRTVATYTTRR
jgi:hypothetical protein